MVIPSSSAPPPAAAATSSPGASSSRASLIWRRSVWRRPTGAPTADQRRAELDHPGIAADRERPGPGRASDAQPTGHGTAVRLYSVTVSTITRNVTGKIFCAP